MSKHIATHGHMGWACNRIGTRYLYSFAEAHAAQDQPWFRWKNDDVRRDYFEWLSTAAASQDGLPALADATKKDPGTEQREASNLLRTIETLPDDFTDDGNCCAGKLKEPRNV